MTSGELTYKAQILCGHFAPDEASELTVREYVDGEARPIMLTVGVGWQEYLIDEEQDAHSGNTAWRPWLEDADKMLGRFGFAVVGAWHSDRVDGTSISTSPYAYHADLAARPEVVDALHALSAATKKLADAPDERDAAVRQLLAANVPVSAAASAAGLVRQRVYQIRDGKR